jgi:hypothetical protein
MAGRDHLHYIACNARASKLDALHSGGSPAAAIAVLPRCCLVLESQTFRQASPRRCVAIVDYAIQEKYSGRVFLSDQEESRKFAGCEVDTNSAD